MKRVLVTGGAGFLGRHLCDRLLREGCQVICADNFYTGSKRNVLEMHGNPYFEVLRHDVCQPLYVEVDEIYNLACPASPVHYQHNPVQTVKTCVHGAINMLGLAKRLGVPVLQARMSVWLITGAQASGKSTIANLLARAFERGVHVRGGQFYRWAVRGWVHFDDENQTEARRLLELRYRLSAIAADEYAAAGFTTVVQDNI
jgi:hypothetical protein